MPVVRLAAMPDSMPSVMDFSPVARAAMLAQLARPTGHYSRDA
jgi:hypothetical protein